MERINIAIDGPAGAGKSTLAKAVAREMNIRYLDTGAMYRAMALYAQRNGVKPSDEAGVMRILDDADVTVRYTGAGQRVLLSGEDVTDLLRAGDLGTGASSIGVHPCVRKKLTELQRAVAREYDVVMDGREITTNVLPHTKFKYYVTASPAERARRRLAEMKARGDESATFERVLEEILRRDDQDKGRVYMPLRIAEDAVVIDTTALSIEQATQRLLESIRAKQAE